jgi:hypothetical protein
MTNLNETAIKGITEFIAEKFERLSLNFLGLIPKVGDKRIIITSNPDSLSSLFLNVLGHRPNRAENEAMKALMFIANSYMDGVREQTTAKIISEIDGYLLQKKFQDTDGKAEAIRKIIDDGLESATKKIEVIVGSESNKTINISTALNIKKIGEERGIDDPVVFFSVTIDDVTGAEEFKLHLLPDRITPRLWKLSEIQGGYHKRGDKRPKFAGLHPWCRCRISVLMPGYGWKNGKLVFKGLDHDEFAEQREKYGMPK